MRYFLALLLTCALVFTTSLTVLAQEPTPEPSEDSREIALTFTELGYDNIILKGAFGSSQIYVPVPGNWMAAQETRVTLQIQSSPLLVNTSNLTVSVNNKPVASTALGIVGDLEIFSFTIPAELITPPGMLIQFQGYLRLTDDICEDSNIPGQWAHVLGSSRLTLYVAQNNELPQLSDLASLMFSRGLEGQPDPLLFVIPDDPDAITLNASVQVAAGLGHLASDNTFPITVLPASEITDEQLANANVVLIGLPNDQPLMQALGTGLSTLGEDGVFYTADDEPVPDSDAVFQVVRSTWNEDRHVLVVSANHPDGLQNAGTVFLDRPTVHQFTGDYTFASGPIPLSNDTLPAPWSTEQTTLEQLGFGTRTVRGTGIINEYYTVFREPGTVFDRGTQFVLQGTASALLDNSESYIAVFLNETPLGTYSTSAFIENQALVFGVPALIDEKGPQQRLTLRIEVSNQVSQQECQAVNRENAWVHLDGGSFFAVNNVHLPLPDLLAFPYPFAAQNPTAPVLIVLPDDFADYHLAGAVRLGFLLGFASPAPIDVNAERLGQFGEAQYADHLIFLADTTDQSQISDLFDTARPEPGATPEGNVSIFGGPSGQLTDLSLYTALKEPFGLVYAGSSPVQPERAVLAIMSDTEAGFESAIDGLSQALPPVSVSGTVAVVQQGRSPYVIYAPEDMNALAEPPAATDEQTIVETVPAENEQETPADNDDYLSTIDASVAIIIIPIVVSLFLVLAIWIFQRGRRNV